MPLITHSLCLTTKGKTFDSKLPGFYVFVAANGDASFNWKGRPEKGAEHKTLPVAKLTRDQISNAAIDKARARATQLVADLRNGKTTVEEVRTQIDNAALTFRAVALQWVETQKKVRSERSWRNLLNNLRRPFAAFGDKAITAVTRRDIQDCLDVCVADGHRAMANMVRTMVCSVFKFAGRRDYVTGNPVHNLEPREKLPSKNRFLDSDELHSFWHALDRTDLPVDRRMALVFKLILCTVLRPSEVLLARRSEIKAWTKQQGGDGRLAYRNPGTEPGRSKKGRVIIQPINSLAEEVIAELLAMPTQDDRLIPPGELSGTLSADNLARALRNLCAFLGCVPFTPHDLRRTGAAHLGLDAISDDDDAEDLTEQRNADIGRCLDHQKQDVTRIYNVAEQVRQTRLRRRTLNRLDTILRDIIGPAPATNVVRLKVA